jgi:protein TonB
MPEVLLNQSSARPVVRSRARWTVTGSFVLHAVLVVTILVSPVLGSPALPPFTRPMMVVFADARPVPPPPAMPPAAVQPRASTFDPTQIPDGIREEKPLAPAPPTLGVPGAFDMPTVGGTSVFSTGRWAPPAIVTPQKPEGPIRPGGNILPPARTSYTAPVYPPIAIQARREGTVILEAVIDEAGAVRDVTVVRSVPLLDRAAIEAVRQWRYSPTRLNGEPVAIILTVRVTFTLK